MQGLTPIIIIIFKNQFPSFVHVVIPFRESIRFVSYNYKEYAECQKKRERV